MIVIFPLQNDISPEALFSVAMLTNLIKIEYSRVMKNGDRQYITIKSHPWPEDLYSFLYRHPLPQHAQLMLGYTTISLFPSPDQTRNGILFSELKFIPKIKTERKKLSDRGQYLYSSPSNLSHQMRYSKLLVRWDFDMDDFIA